MSKRDEFITLVNEILATSPTINTEQYRGLLRRAINKYELSVDEASKILQDLGLNIGEADNYFEILGLSIEELQSLNEDAIVTRVMEAHDKSYKVSLNAGGRIRSDGRTEEQWRTLLNQARDTLSDLKKREAYIANLLQERDVQFLGSEHPILKFRNGDEAFNIPQLAQLMLKHSNDAIDALYRGYLEQSLGRIGEMHFADAAQSVVSEFPENQGRGLRVMVSILQEKLEFQEGGDVQTPAQLANAIDINWEQGKNMLFNGVITLWLKYTKQPELANIAQEIVMHYKVEQDIGLEKLVQSLHPGIGHPILHINHESIDFGKVDTETQKKIHLEIKNMGRGFLYGNLQLNNDIPGIQLSTMTIRGNTNVTLELDARLLASKKMYKTELVINTNLSDSTAPSSKYLTNAELESPINSPIGNPSGNITIPIAFYVDYPVLKSIRRVAASGASIGAIALAACLIILLIGDSGWLTSRLTNTGFVTFNPDWVPWSDGWLWQDWTIYILGSPSIGYQFIIALASLVAGVFIYRFFFIKRRGKQ